MAGTCTVPLKGGITYAGAYVRIEDPTVVMQRVDEDHAEKSYALVYNIVMYKDAETTSPLPQTVRSARQNDVDPAKIGDPWIAAYKHLQTSAWVDSWEDVLEDGQTEKIAAHAAAIAK